MNPIKLAVGVLFSTITTIFVMFAIGTHVAASERKAAAQEARKPAAMLCRYLVGAKRCPLV